MQRFHFHADLDDPEALVTVIRAITGESDIRLSQRDAVGNTDPDEPAAINIEWLRRKGRFRLDAFAWGRSFCPRQTQARFVRAFAKTSGRSALFSDCSAFGFSYFMADPDGAIWYVVIAIGDEDIMELLSPDPNDPNHFIPKLVFEPNDSLPELPDGAPTSWQRGDTTCEVPVAGKPCRVFAMACPKSRFRPSRSN